MARVPEPQPEQRRAPIAVFDSGVGGLTVLHELLVSLPEEDYLYLGDTQRFPYGTRSPEELAALSLEIARTLLDTGAKLLVVACNSATAAALPALRSELQAREPPVEIIDVIAPAAELAVAATGNGRIGLLATPATIASGASERALAAHDSEIALTTVACPDLAPIIQRDFPFDEHVVDTVRGYCRPLQSAGVDTVILGSTHYPLVAPMLQRILGRRVRLIASGVAVADRVEDLLERRALRNPREGEGAYRFLCTGEPESFRALGSRFLQMPLGEVAHVELRTPLAA